MLIRIQLEPFQTTCTCTVVIVTVRLLLVSHCPHQQIFIHQMNFPDSCCHGIEINLVSGINVARLHLGFEAFKLTQQVIQSCSTQFSVMNLCLA